MVSAVVGAVTYINHATNHYLIYLQVPFSLSFIGLKCPAIHSEGESDIAYMVYRSKGLRLRGMHEYSMTVESHIFGALPNVYVICGHACKP
jgi:hypothetical protein